MNRRGNVVHGTAQQHGAVFFMLSVRIRISNY